MFSFVLSYILYKLLSIYIDFLLKYWKKNYVTLKNINFIYQLYKLFWTQTCPEGLGYARTGLRSHAKYHNTQ